MQNNEISIGNPGYRVACVGGNGHFSASPANHALPAAVGGIVYAQFAAVV